MMLRRQFGLACLAALAGGSLTGCNSGQTEIPLAKVPPPPPGFGEVKLNKKSKPSDGHSPLNLGPGQ